MNCIICNQEIENDSQFINGNWYHNRCIENQQKEIERLNNIIYREISNYILKKYGMLDDTHYHDFLNELELKGE